MINVGTFTGKLSDDVVREIAMVAGVDDAPFWALMLARGLSAPTVSESPEWYSASVGARTTLVNGAAFDETTTALVVDDASVFLPSDVILFEATREVGLVQAVVTATNTLTITRGHGATLADALSVADNAVVRNIGNAAGEGADIPGARLNDNTKITNLVQTFRESIDVTGRMTRVNQDTEEVRAEERKKKFQEILRDIEQALFHGVKGTGTNANGERVTTMDGLLTVIASSVNDVGGALAIADIETFSEQMFAFGAKRKVGFAGSRYMTAVSKLYGSALRVTAGEVLAGIRVTELQTPHGFIELVNHTGIPSGTLVGVDMDHVRIRPTNGGQLRLVDGRSGNGADREQEEWMAEHTLQYSDERFHFVQKGVTG